MASQLESFSKEQLIKYVEILSKNILTIDGYYFLGIERRYGLERAIEIDEEAWGQYGKTEAKRIKELLKIDEGDLGSLKMAIGLVAFGPVSGIKAELEGKKLLVSITRCRPQYARVRDGKGEFPCKPVGLAHLSAFAREINPRIKTRCVCAPPDSHPKEYYCRWEFTLD
ncbi:MAG: DUF6125 family protein [Candidatus Methanomethylicia archaeon]|nr:DUF6125 family protein [Candidatus Methanomethylicia archaeon]